MMMKFRFMKMPLESAVDDGDYALAIVRLQANDDPYIAYYNDTPLFFKAVQSNHQPLIDAFIKAFANLIFKKYISKDYLGSYLIEMVRQNKMNIAQKILEAYHGANVKPDDDVLILSFENKQYDFVKKLIKSGANPYYSMGYDYILFEKVVATGMEDLVDVFIEAFIKRPRFGPLAAFCLNACLLKLLDTCKANETNANALPLKAAKGLLKAGANPCDYGVFEKAIEIRDEEFIDELFKVILDFERSRNDVNALNLALSTLTKKCASNPSIQKYVNALRDLIPNLMFKAPLAGLNAYQAHIEIEMQSVVSSKTTPSTATSSSIKTSNGNQYIESSIRTHGF